MIFFLFAQVLLGRQVRPGPRDPLALRGLPEQGTTEPTFRLLTLWVGGLC